MPICVLAQEQPQVYYSKKYLDTNIKAEYTFKEKVTRKRPELLAKLKKKKQKLSAKLQKKDSATHVLNSKIPKIELTSNTVSKVSLDWPHEEQGRIKQRVLYQIHTDVIAIIHIKSWQLREQDSLLLYDITYSDKGLNAGVNTITLNIEKGGENRYVDYSFLEVIKKLGEVPPGMYVKSIDVITDSGTNLYKKLFYNEVDSAIGKGSILKTDINDQLFNKKERRLFDKAAKRIKLKQGNSLNKQLSYIQTRNLNNKLKNKGYEFESVIEHGRSYTYVYYKSWFVGKYELFEKNKLKEKIRLEELDLDRRPFNLNTPSLPNYTTISGKAKKTFKRGKEREESRGNIDIASYFGNDQEPGSQQDNSYQEYYGDLHTKVIGLPIYIEGYYTSQDKGRQAKASFIRFSYDVSEAKSQLSEHVSGYKNAYTQSFSKLKGMNNVYGTYIKQLEKYLVQQKLAFQADYEVDMSGWNSTENGLNTVLTELPDSSDSIYGKEKRAELERRYKKIQATRQSIDKYKKLLEQWENSLFFDSSLSYEPLSSLSMENNISHKRLAKASKHILPEGANNSFLAGLTKLNIGVINEYESKYTMAGQTLRGGSVGYDFGYVTVVGALGKTEYVNREGNVDKYNSYLIGFNSLIAADQTVGLNYYTYKADKGSLSSPNFYQDVTRQPTTIEPVSVVSLNYKGVITDRLLITSEGAVSYRNHKFRQSDLSLNNSAINLNVSYVIPKTPITVEGELEQMGKNFENQSLPYIRSAIERYMIAGKADVLKSFLTLGVQFNYMKQKGFTSVGHSRKWGFDIKTNSKRYPNIYVSYKPFSTFRSYDDTLNINQRPLFGEVLLLRGNYQYKRRKVVHRFIAAFNKNKTVFDTAKYNSNTLQLGYIYSSSKNIVHVNAGWLSVPQQNSIGPSDSYFMDVGYSRSIFKNVNINLGQGIALASFGVQRTTSTIGSSYSFERMPITLRVSVRYSDIKITEQSANQKIWMGNLAANWRFKYKKY